MEHDFKRIPQSTMADINEYIHYRQPPGGFLRAVLENDLCQSFARAHISNRAAMFDIVCYLHNFAPSDCWGSPEKVKSWLES